MEFFSPQVSSNIFHRAIPNLRVLDHLLKATHHIYKPASSEGCGWNMWEMWLLWLLVKIYIVKTKEKCTRWCEIRVLCGL